MTRSMKFSGALFSRVGSVLAVAVLLGACATSGSNTNGSGNVESESRTVSGFTAVELTGAGEVTIDQTGTDSLTIEADDNLLPKVTSSVVDGTLILGVEGNVSTSTPIKFIVTATTLNRIVASGSGTISARNLTTDTLDVNIGGSADVTVRGAATSQSVTIGGSGSYQAHELVSDSATVTISGSGNATVQATDTLDISISGSGSVASLGNPTVDQDVSGSGRVTHE
jgi:hypothetical protein